MPTSWLSVGSAPYWSTHRNTTDGHPMHRIIRSSPLNVSIHFINVNTWLQAPRLWCHLRSMGWMGPEVWGKGRIPGTAPCTPANCCFYRDTSKDPPPPGVQNIYNNLNISVTAQQYFKEEEERAPVFATSPFRREKKGFSTECCLRWHWCSVKKLSSSKHSWRSTGVGLLKAQ